jgi:phenylalanyl-tRNA synthetase alpha chain
MHPSILGAEALRRSLSIRDLTDSALGPHALQILIHDVVEALHAAWGAEVVLHRACPIVSIKDNYDRLHYPEGGAARDARYTRYTGETTLLRTQTSAMIPPLLRALSAAPPEDALLVCPGLVYRRDSIDRLHTGEPHQIDLWRIARGKRLDRSDLERMIALVAGALLPGAEVRWEDAAHPYTLGGLQIDVRARGEWVEIGECGLALPALLAESGLDAARWSGLAMGLGLDRILMLRKGIDDIRLLRSVDARVSRQMLDLAPYRAVSTQPAIRRDLSIAVDADDTPEQLGDRVREALGDHASSVEAIEVLSETPAAGLPAVAAARIGIGAGQKNVLLRVVIRDLDRTLTHAEANGLRDRVYAALHRGTSHQWASGGPPAAGS